ncbi:hypothetical protein ABMY35_01095 [Pseudoalteromonas sp. BZB3]|uniref:hypothetical protein n=1 Tax=Pseudoalteromonas sp. BZB3 TaxID=3136670 RepID=UPI0032C43310
MSYISNPQNNASLLAEILTNMDPSQHDAVVLLNQLTESVSGLAYAQVSSMLRGHSDWQDGQAQIGNVAELVAISIKHGVEINDLINAVAGNTSLVIGNGHAINDLATALTENLTMSLGNGVTANTALGLGIENAMAEIQQAQNEIKEMI